MPKAQGMRKRRTEIFDAARVPARSIMCLLALQLKAAVKARSKLMAPEIQNLRFQVSQDQEFTAHIKTANAVCGNDRETTQLLFMVRQW